MKAKIEQQDELIQDLRQQLKNKKTRSPSIPSSQVTQCYSNNALRGRSTHNRTHSNYLGMKFSLFYSLKIYFNKFFFFVF